MNVTEGKPRKIRQNVSLDAALIDDAKRVAAERYQSLNAYVSWLVAEDLRRKLTVTKQEESK